MRLKQIHGVAVENLPTPDGQKFDPVKFKLLLNHRKLELQGQASFPFLAGFNPAAALGLGLGVPRDGGEGGPGGLDLRFKASDDDDMMSDAGSDIEERDTAPRAGNRRKPAQPQWVNPDWEETGHKVSSTDPSASSEKQEPINGVCVRNMAAFGDQSSAENTQQPETS